MIAQRIEDISESGSIALARRIAELKKAGVPIVSLAIGEPDFIPHQKILEATRDALFQGATRYSSVEGIPELREQIAERFQAKTGLSVQAQHILLSNGSKQVLYNIFQTLCNPEDEVLVPTPYWVTFPEAIKLSGARPVIVPTENLRVTLEQLQKAQTSRTKAVILNSPNNPSGLIIPPDEFKRIAAWIRTENLVLISDEAYEAFTYDQAPSSLLTHCPELFEQTLTVQSFSKTFGMTGFRQGYVIASSNWIQAISKLQSHLTGNNCTFAQYGALAALRLGDVLVEEYRQEFKKRRDYAYERARKIFPDCPKPEGAFYLYPQISRWIQSNRFKNDTDMANKILEEAQVALLPGSFFGTPGYLRLSFAASLEDIGLAFDRLESYL